MGVASHAAAHAQNLASDRMATNFVLETSGLVVAAEPHWSQLFNFPKRTFERKKVVKRSFQPSCFTRWPFLHYDESTDAVFCHTCLSLKG